MLDLFRQKQSYSSHQKFQNNNNSLKNKPSTETSTTCITFSHNLEKDNVQKKQQISFDKSLIISQLKSKILHIQKAQFEAQQKFEKCVSSLQNQIINKQHQNNKLKQQIEDIRLSIAQEKNDLQIIKNYSFRITAKKENSQKNSTKIQEQNNTSPMRSKIFSYRQKLGNNSRGKALTKALHS